MLNQAFAFLVDSVFTLFLMALLARFWMQTLRAPFSNPIGQFVVAITDFAVRPVRRLVPGWRGYDLATLLLAFVTAFILLVLLNLVSPRGVGMTGGPVVPLAFAWLAAIHLVRLTLYLLIGAVLVQAILSWVAPYGPLAPLLNTITRPVLRPVQRRLPMVGGVDLSPLVVLLACQLLLMVPVAWLEQLGVGLLYRAALH